MKQQLASLIQTALDTLQSQGVLPADVSPKIQIDRARDASHGDYLQRKLDAQQPRNFVRLFSTLSLLSGTRH